MSDQKGLKTIPFGATHTYIAYIRDYPPPGEYVGYSSCHLLRNDHHIDTIGDLTRMTRNFSIFKKTHRKLDCLTFGKL